METRRSSKRKERDEAPPSGPQQTTRKSQRSSAKPAQAAGGESTDTAAVARSHVTTSNREAERSNSQSGGPATRLRAKRAAAAAPPPLPAASTRARRTRAKAREPSTEVEEAPKEQPKEDVKAQLPQPAQLTGTAAAETQATEADKLNLGPRRLTPSQLREMANRSGRGQGMEDDKDLAEVFGRNFSGAGSALQGLLRKLGAGFEDMMPMGGMSGSRLKAIMQGLRQTDDEGAQLSSLSELNELLAISSEDNLAGFPTESMVPLLIQLLNAEHNPDIMLMAARALTFLADVLPQSCGAIVRHGAVPAFCARLLTIEYIDLAEQSLQALEKLSHEHSPALLQNGGLLAVLSYLDFFPTGVQRTATATAANICRSLAMSPSAASSSAAQAAVKDAIPILTGLLHYSDAKVVDSACVSLSYIAEASAGQPNLLEALTSGGLVGQALQLIGVSETGAMTSQLSLSTYYGLLKLLSTAAASSATVATTLLGSGALATARTLLSTSPLFINGPGGGGGGALLRTPDQLHELLGLLSELLPPVQDSQTLVTLGAAVELPVAEQPAGGRGTELQGYLAAHPQLTAQLCGDVLPLVLSSYSATVMPEVRARALRVLLQLLVSCPAAQLREALRDLPLASFLASLLGARDAATLAAALHCCEVLMAQLPDVFKQVFLKEGVAYAVEQLAASAQSAAAGGAVSPPPAPPPPVLSPPPHVPAEEPRRGKKASRLPTFSVGREERSAAAVPAPSMGPGSRMPPSSPGGTSLRAALAARALRFMKAHYDAGCGAPETEGLVQVRTLIQRLPVQPTATLSELLKLMAGSTTAGGLSGTASGGGDVAAASVSVFELLNSGAIKSLYDFLTGADVPQPQADDPSAADERATAILRRIAALTRAGLTPTEGWPCNPPLVGLVRKLQTALSSMETFPVHYGRAAPPSGTGSYRGGGYGSRAGSAGSTASALNPGSLSSGLSLLTHPFKLRLCRHTSDGSLRDYSSNIVLIEPLATMSAIEEFLWPRVYRGTVANATAAQQATGPAATTQAPSGPGTAPSATEGTTAGTSGKTATATAATGAAGSRSHPIPVDDSASNRRVTRSQAARERAEEDAARRSGAVPVPTRTSNRRGVGAATGTAGKDVPAAAVDGSAAVGVAGLDQRMGDVGADGMEDEDAAHGVGTGRRRTRGRLAAGGGSELEVPEDDGHESQDGDGDGDAEMEDAGAAADAMFDDDDEDFDEDGMDGDDGDVDMGTMHVHDLHVEDPTARGGPPGGQVPPPPLTSQHTQQPHSFAAPSAAAAFGRPGGAWASRAAAAAAELAAAEASAAAGSLATRGPRSAAHEAAAPRMTFFLGDDRQPLSASSTVFQAIQQLHNQQHAAAEAEEDGEEVGGARRGRRLWDEVHTLYYRPAGQSGSESSAAAGARGATAPAGAGAEPAAAAASAGTGGAAGAEANAAAANGSLGRWGATPLRDLLAPRVPADLPCPPSCREVLALLALLEAINRLGPRACAELDAVGAGGPEEEAAGPLEVVRHAPRDEFVSAKLSSKLGQQLKDVLSICGGGMPAWCSALAAPCRFLFPFEIRKRYFYCTAFGLGRALQHMQQQHTAEAGGTMGGGHGGADRDGRELRVGRLQRQKVRVSRKRILESAAKVMELYGRSRAVLELEYFNEVGTGLGPTLEFYTLLSHELQRKELGMWRHEEQDDTQREEQGQAEQEAAEQPNQQQPMSEAGEVKEIVEKERAPASPESMEVDEGTTEVAAVAAPAPLQARTSGPVPAAAAGVSVPSRRGEAAGHEESEYVNAPWGLFPRPLPPSVRSSPAGMKVVEHFRLLGRSVAKALQDNRLLDLPLSHVFYAAALGSPLDLWDIGRFDPGLGATMGKLHSILAAHRNSGSVAGPLLVDGVALEDLCLTFVLPGQPDYPLCPGGADEVVSTPEQLGRYVEAVVEATLGSGVALQMASFREGFNEVFNLSTLSLFHEDEIEVLLCGSGERWTSQMLAEAIKFDHGYTASSQPVRFLIEILSELDAADQRAFLRFVTGCPRLPPGGLTALQPRLTVVRKHPSGGDGPSTGPTPVGSFQDAGLAAAACCAADADLPSVMTCANYVKLPPYSSKSIMAARLMYAIREGQGSFDLS